MNTISRIKAREIDDNIATRWRTLQASNPALANPYFNVEYLQSVAAVRDDVFVSIIEEAGEVIGFFPWQSKDGRVAAPVGGRLSDYQGIIGVPERRWDYDAILDASGPKIWDFDHLLASQPPASVYRKIEDVSPIMEMRDGFEAYLAERKQAGAKRIDQFRRKARKFEREVGELVVECYSDSEEAFRQVIEWKNAQCRRTGVPEFLTWGWTEGMLREIWRRRSKEFAGMLTIIRANDEIIAGHFGMRSASVCHWWFPTYNAAYGKYSPGGILLLKLAEAVAGEGISMVDLGKGDDAYKPSFANAEVPLLEGSVMRPSITAMQRRLTTETRHFLKESAATEPLRGLYRKIKESRTPGTAAADVKPG